MRQSHTKDIGYAIVVAIVGWLLLLPGSNSLELLRQGDEVMHIASVRESLDHGAFLIPQLTSMPNAYKPPLLFWMGMLGELLFGRSLFADRFLVAGMGGGIAAFLFLMMRLHRRSVGYSLATVFVFLFSLTAFKFGRLLMMDLPMAFFLTAVAWLLLRQKLTAPRSNRYVLWAGLLTGVAFLLKGPLFHVYAALLFVSWIALRLWSVASLSNDKRFRSVLKLAIRQGIVFALSSLIVPVLWVIALVAAGKTGSLWFFFVIENAGKFSAENQSSVRIFGGWLLYLLPFTLPVIWIVFRSLKEKVQNQSTYTARVFLIAAILITLLHLLPDRKDAYYVVPVMPLVIAAVALVFRPDRITIGLVHLQNIILAFVVIVLAFLFLSVFWAVAVTMLMVAFLVVSMIAKKWTWLFVPCVVMLVGQFVLLPKITRPVVTPDALSMIANQKACVVSRNWWDVFEIKLYTASEVLHASPDDIQSCTSQKLPLIVIQEDVQTPQEYTIAKTWSHWSIRSVSLPSFSQWKQLSLWKEPFSFDSKLYLPVAEQ